MSSGLTGVRSEFHWEPLAFDGDIKEQTEKILQQHKASLEARGSSLANASRNVKNGEENVLTQN